MRTSYALGRSVRQRHYFLFKHKFVKYHLRQRFKPAFSRACFLSISALCGCHRSQRSALFLGQTRISATNAKYGEVEKIRLGVHVPDTPRLLKPNSVQADIILRTVPGDVQEETPPSQRRCRRLAPSARHEYERQQH